MIVGRPTRALHLAVVLARRVVLACVLGMVLVFRARVVAQQVGRGPIVPHASDVLKIAIAPVVGVKVGFASVSLDLVASRVPIELVQTTVGVTAYARQDAALAMLVGRAMSATQWTVSTVRVRVQPLLRSLGDLQEVWPAGYWLRSALQ
jgi:hypothetical protein